MYSDAEIRQKQQLARAAGLSGTELLDDAAAVRRDCNGIGAAWMPDATREWISTANPSLWWLLTFTTGGIALGGPRQTGRPPTLNFAPTA